VLFFWSGGRVIVSWDGEWVEYATRWGGQEGVTRFGCGQKGESGLDLGPDFGRSWSYILEYSKGKGAYHEERGMRRMIHIFTSRATKEVKIDVVVCESSLAPLLVRRSAHFYFNLQSTDKRLRWIEWTKTKQTPSLTLSVQIIYPYSTHESVLDS